MVQPVIGIFNTQESAEQAIRDLKGAGFGESDIGLVMPDHSVHAAREDNGTLGTEGVVAGGILGGAIGALLAATGALVIPGIGPIITGGILTALIGGAAGGIVGGLAGMGVAKEEVDYYEQQVKSGRTLVVVQAGDRTAEAVPILARRGGEVKRPADGVGIAMETPAYSPVTPVTNVAEQSGQVRDMMRSTSDDGTIPPSAAREEITAGVDPRVVSTNERQDYLLAKPALSPDVRTTDTIGPDAKDAQYDHPEKAPAATGAVRQHEAGALDPAPLSPSDPRRDTNEGQPYLDDANPYGRALPNQQNRQMGGVGVLPDPTAAQRRHEQPGDDAANPLPQALDPEPRRDPERG